MIVVRELVNRVILRCTDVMSDNVTFNPDLPEN